MSRALAEEAWDAVKPKEDPKFAATTADHQQELITRAEGVVRTGVTVDSGGVFQDFEEKVKELHEADRESESQATESKTEAKTKK